jgi:signal transduction histidine kinase
MTVKVISTLVLYFIIAGFIIILLVFFISIYLAFTITAPLKKITLISHKIAAGNLRVRAEKVSNDEIGILSESINHMADEIQKTDKLKNEFISSVTHEIKTPLTSIKGWAVTLGDTEREDFDIIRRGINIINNETDRLTDMVNELLDFSRLNSGKFSLTMAPVDINSLLKDAVEQMKPRAERQNIMLELSISGQCTKLLADERRVRQVMLNLLDNSLKYTQNGGKITITAGLRTNAAVLGIRNWDKCENSAVSSTTTASDRGRINSSYAITVEDNGRGISTDELPLIRNRFYRGKNIGNENGIGLGLSICDELISAHGGSINIDSKAGVGTKVTILLPVDC